MYLPMERGDATTLRCCRITASACDGSTSPQCGYVSTWRCVRVRVTDGPSNDVDAHRMGDTLIRRLNLD